MPPSTGRLRQPEPADPAWPRYSRRPFPSYRFVPGDAPHPLRDPEGHSFRRSPTTQRPFPPDRWRSAPSYLFGIDCYNFAYWWESHEVLEEIWHAVGHRTEQGRFLQALIQVDAAWLHRFRGRETPARRQASSALARLAETPDPFMGVPTRAFAVGVRDHLDGRRPTYPLIRLHAVAGGPRG